MKLPVPLVEACFLSRANRFACWVEMGGRALAHLPNSGRLHDLLVPGRPVLLYPSTSPRRKTPCDLLLVDLEGTLVSVDARLLPKLVAEAFQAGRLVSFSAYHRLEREVRLGKKRLDLLLCGEGGVLYLEVKSVTLVEDGVALFPDAPTKRGREHLQELLRVQEGGGRGVVAFVIQRPDARALSPHDRADPEFGRLLRLASARGVGIYAFVCEVSRQEIEIAHEIPVLL